MRAKTNISLKDRKTLILSDFKGVDFSSSPLRVKNNRATKMRNLINEYGVNKKRNGWKQILKFDDPINGFFEYNHGTRKEIIVYAGTTFYSVTEEENGVYSRGEINAPTEVKLMSQRIQVFSNKGRAYIIGCGDYLVYGTWDDGINYELRQVFDDEDTYVPTTTISIDYDGAEDDIRASLDDVNILSSRRKNQLVGAAETAKNGTTWTLDTSIAENTLVEIEIETLEGEEKTPVTYEIHNENADKTYGDELYYKNNAKSCGSIDFEKGKITLNCSTVPQIENRDNIIVTFYHANEHANEDYVNRIPRCSFGTLFGVEGNTDRLFLSGNPYYPNIDFHSEENDFTYFSDLGAVALGSDTVPINGYGRLSDSTLVVYKQENSMDPSVFFRTGRYETKYDSKGRIASQRAIFSHRAGNIGEGNVSTYACANLVGDNLMLSSNGVQGIVLASNVATAERYARERSRMINERLTREENLSEAVSIVYKNRYYLSVNGNCYVADARYKFTTNDDIDGSYNYEWWFWDNIPARVWATIENDLYFGTNDGRICVFDDKYTDRTYIDTVSGDLGLDVSDKHISYNEKYIIANGDRITFNDGCQLYALMLSAVKVEENRIKTNEDKILTLRNNMEVYVDNVTETGLEVDTKYIVKNIDLGNCDFELADGNEELVTLNAGGFNMYQKLNGKELFITAVKDNTFELRQYAEGSSLDLSKYNGSSDQESPLAKLEHRQNVVAEWYTPVFDFGTNDSSKTLLKMTISTEPEVNGKVAFGYETRRVERLLNARGINVFTLDNLSFNNFSFDTIFANSYSVKCNERNFNFIIFRFTSDNDSNCAVNSITATYKINRPNRGAT